MMTREYDAVWTPEIVTSHAASDEFVRLLASSLTIGVDEIDGRLFSYDDEVLKATLRGFIKGFEFQPIASRTELASRMLEEVIKFQQELFRHQRVRFTLLGYIQQAVQIRMKSMFRPGVKVRLTGTRNPELDGRLGTVIKVNAKRVSVGLGNAQDGYGNRVFFEREYNVPPEMLELV